MQVEDFDKTLIHLYKELQAIRKLDRELGYEELNPPVQRGWKRIFVLRDELARSKDARFYQGILDKINTTKYSWRKDFKKKKRHRGRKIYVVRGQELQTLEIYWFEKKKFTEKEKAYFELLTVTIPNSNKIEYIYRFTAPGMFTLRVFHNMITKTKIRDFNLERRSDEIRLFLERNNFWPRLQKLIHGHYQYRCRWKSEDLEKYKNPLHNRSFADILDEYLPESTLTVSFKNPRKSGGFSLGIYLILRAITTHRKTDLNIKLFCSERLLTILRQ
jgi:hypothetical protein